MAVKSITSSTGHGTISEVQNPDRRVFLGNIRNIPLMSASSRLDWGNELNRNDETRNNEDFGDGDFPAFRPNYDRRAHANHSLIFSVSVIILISIYSVATENSWNQRLKVISKGNWNSQKTHAVDPIIANTHGKHKETEWESNLDSFGSNHFWKTLKKLSLRQGLIYLTWKSLMFVLQCFRTLPIPSFNPNFINFIEIEKVEPFSKICLNGQQVASYDVSVKHSHPSNPSILVPWILC